ncbi:MAG TPA: TetR/AcrR family transcriptional regulator [Candidatus Limnocylindria bacterium]|nr:TetR/AcrR family transcriptional regulator [Candidatus Limnocylindria bacterium]
MSTSRGQIDNRRRILDTARPIFASKGFSAVGLSEILTSAKVPKGSFYHYFASKEAFGEALLEEYFAGYLARVEAILSSSRGRAADRVLRFCEDWSAAYVNGDVEDQCLVVQLGAEVSDLSDRMRAILREGTSRVIGILARCLDEGLRDGSVRGVQSATDTATALYQLWLGATLLSKFTRNGQPFDVAMESTRRQLGLPPSVTKPAS